LRDSDEAFQIDVLTDGDKYWCMHDRLPPKRCMCSWSRDLFKYCEITDNISETVQDRETVATED